MNVHYLKHIRQQIFDVWTWMMCSIQTLSEWVPHHLAFQVNAGASWLFPNPDCFERMSPVFQILLSFLAPLSSIFILAALAWRPYQISTMLRHNSCPGQAILLSVRRFNSSCRRVKRSLVNSKRPRYMMAFLTCPLTYIDLSRPNSVNFTTLDTLLLCFIANY